MASCLKNNFIDKPIKSKAVAPDADIDASTDTAQAQPPTESTASRPDLLLSDLPSPTSFDPANQILCFEVMMV